MKNEKGTLSDVEAVSRQEAVSPERAAAAASGASLLQQAQKEFFRALNRALRAAASGKLETSIGWCRYAASVAWGANPGIFYCHEIEQLLAEIGRKHFGPSSAAAPSAGPPRRFLHVVSTAFGTGGPTRVVARWIEICAQHAPSELHSILVSMQNGAPLPTWLIHSAQRTGGEIVEVPSGLSWLQAAAQIRSRSLEFDAVVLHIHPNDPLPNVAFFDRPRPVLFFRHSDHTFNLGLDVARVFGDIRPAGREMSIRFCAKEPRKVMLPLPLLDEELTDCEKAEARRRLGLPVDAIIALTIGWVLKFAPIADYNFAEVVQSICASNPRVHIVAVGLSEAEPFPGLGRSVGGRFMPVGVVNDRELLELYYRASDIYLDAYPCSSLTALLDAARHGLPVQRLYNRHQCLLWGEDLALDSVVRGASTQNEFIAGVLDWLEWPEEKRIELGARFRSAVLQDHCGASWKSKWLDPATNALIAPCEVRLDLSPDRSQTDELEFPGLGAFVPQSDWPAGMFVAGAIHSTSHLPRPVRISGVIRSIRPALFGSVGNGTRRQRLLMLGLLVASLVPTRIRTTMRFVWRAIPARGSSK